VRVYSGICTLGMVSDLPEGPHTDYLLFIYSPCSNIVITWMILGFWNCPVSSRRCTAFVFKTWLLLHLTTPWTYGLHRLRKVACIQGLQTREDLAAPPLPLEIHSRQRYHRWAHLLHTHCQGAHILIPGFSVSLLSLMCESIHSRLFHPNQRRGILCMRLISTLLCRWHQILEFR
jgi:hypothetical protein